MNIGIFTNNYFPRVNGVVHSINGFKQELEQRGHNVFIFAPKCHNHHQEKGVFRFRSLRVSKKLQPDYYPLPPIPITYSPKIKKVTQKLNLDVIHTQQPYALGKTAQQYAQELGIPLIFTNHAPYYQFLDFLPTGLANFLESYPVSLVVDYAHKCQIVIAPTATMKESLIEIGIQTPVRVVPSGINLAHFQKQEVNLKIRKKYSLPKKALLLVLVSRLSCEKNISFLLEVFKTIVKKKTNIYLMIIGEGLQRKALKNTVNSLGIQDKVIFTGQVDYKELPCYYRAGDLFVYPSLIDSQGLVLIEAMAAGLPAVAIKETIGPSNIICHNKTGFLVSHSQEEFTKAIMRLVNNKGLRQKFSKVAQEQAQQYSIQSSTDKLLAVYQEAIK